MTDPVRPVAQQLLTSDVPNVLRLAAIHCHNDLREHRLSVGPWTEDCREHYTCRVYLDYCAHLKSAAAPVPCAASPADYRIEVEAEEGCFAVALWRGDSAFTLNVFDTFEEANAYRDSLVETFWEPRATGA